MEPKAPWVRDSERGYGFMTDHAGTRLRVDMNRVTVGDQAFSRAEFHLDNLFEAMAFAEEKAQEKTT